MKLFTSQAWYFPDGAEAPKPFRCGWTTEAESIEELRGKMAKVIGPLRDGSILFVTRQVPQSVQKVPA